jgi:hypothetical protein
MCYFSTLAISFQHSHSFSQESQKVNNTKELHAENSTKNICVLLIAGNY